MSEMTVPFISEHESGKSSGNEPPGYRPDPDEKKAIELVEKLYSKAKRYRKRYDSKWIDFYKMFRGRQWKEVRPSYRHSEVLNLVFQTIQSMVPILTDSKPKLGFLPTVPGNDGQRELAEILDKVAENDWEHNNWLFTLTEILFDSHFYGTGFGYCGWDPKANQGLGNICFESYDPFYVFPDPAARDINDRRCKYVAYAEPISLATLKKEYPDKAQYLTSDVMDLAQGDKADIYQVSFKSPVDNKLMMEGPGGYDLQSKEEALKLTCWLKDDASEEVEQDKMNEDGTPAVDGEGNPSKEFVQKLKYPNGRRIVTAGGVLLEDGPFEFEDGIIPIAKLVNYILPREFWGMGEVEQLDGPQKTINKMISFTLDVMTLMGNPIWKVGTAAGIDTDNLFNKPGLVIEADDINQIQREEGVGLPPFILQMLDRYKQYFDGISGESDLSRGAEPTGVTAASAISALQQAQQTRLRLKTRNIDAFLQNFGKMYLNRVFEKYNVPRIVRVSGDDGAQRYFHFHVEQVAQPDGTIKRFANIVDYSQTDLAGSPMSKQIEITGDFDVRISTGSTLPFAKEEKTNISMKLFQLGVIDDEELLKGLDYPNYEGVLARVNQKKQMMAQQQMAMQAQGAPPPAPPPGAA